MKTVTIGDIHGRPDWIKAQGDLIILLGDYADGSGVPGSIAYENLKNIIAYKKEHPDQMKLLIGNHDLHYIFLNTDLFRYVHCSRFDPAYAKKFNQLFNENIDLFQPAFQINNCLWTHAGLNNTSYQRYIAPCAEPGETVSDTINKLWGLKHKALLHVGRIRGGYSEYGSIFWADFDETYPDPLAKHHQIVGHSRVDKIITKHYALDTSITYTDCLSKSPETFYELELFFNEEKEAA